MKVFALLYIVFSITFVPSSSTSPITVDPFDTSHQRCETIAILRCITILPHSARSFTVGEVISIFSNRPFSEIRQLNGWKKGEVTRETILPKGKKVALSGSI
jgi:hypothetical protein